MIPQIIIKPFIILPPLLRELEKILYMVRVYRILAVSSTRIGRPFIQVEVGKK